MLVFVYGTLTDPGRAARVLDTFSYEGEATLRGFHRVEGTYPTLAPGGSVEGRLLRTDEIDALDAYEGVDQGLYDRVTLPVVDATDGRPGASDAPAGDHRTAAVYVGDPIRLDASTEWPGTAPFPACIRQYVDAERPYVKIN